MEFVAGMTLQQKLDKSGPLPVAEVLRIGQQIAAGLAAAHATGHVHRDIKPGNILLENGIERVKITDFGLARAADDASISHSGIVAGTPMYMAPEQARGEHIDHRADLFSLGSVLYAMCTGHPPFRASTTLAILKRVAEEEPRPVREVNPEIPQWLAAVVAKLHAKNPDDRFQTAKEVAELLAKYLSEFQQHGSVIAPAMSPAAPPSRWRRLVIGASVLALVVLCCIGVYALTRPEPKRDDNPTAPPTPPTAPHTPAEPQSQLLKAFTANDKPLNLAFPNAGTITSEDGGWKIVSGANGTTPLFSWGNLNVQKGTLTFRARVRSCQLAQERLSANVHALGKRTRRLPRVTANLRGERLGCP